MHHSFFIHDTRKHTNFGDSMSDVLRPLWNSVLSAPIIFLPFVFDSIYNIGAPHPPPRRDPLLLAVYARWAQAAEDKHFLMLAARCHLAAFQVRSAIHDAKRSTLTRCFLSPGLYDLCFLERLGSFTMVWCLRCLQPAAAVSLLARRHHTLTRGFPLAVAPHLAFAAARPLLTADHASALSGGLATPVASNARRRVIVRVPAVTDPMLLRTATLLAGACGLDHVYASLAPQYARVCEDAALSALHNVLLATVSEVELSRLAGNANAAVSLSPAFHAALRSSEMAYSGSLIYEAPPRESNGCDDGISIEVALGGDHSNPATAAEQHAARLRIGLAQEAASIYAHHTGNRDECRVRGALLSLRVAIARWLVETTWQAAPQDGDECTDHGTQCDARLVAAFAAIDPHSRALLCSSVIAGSAAAPPDSSQSAALETDMLARIAVALRYAVR